MRKKLEGLYAWSEFYRTNMRVSDLERVQVQIKEFKVKHNLD
jgi:hypothetical protein